MTDAIRWQNALRQKFPGAMVRFSSRLVQDEILNLDVHLAKEDQYPKFIEFVLGEMLDFRDQRRLPDADLIPHSYEETLKYFPEVFQKSGQASKTSNPDSKPKQPATRKKEQPSA